MKKNAMLKIAAILMVAVLLTTCAISSTFAKYASTATSTDSARVAKWGVTASLNITDLFAGTYASDTSGYTGATVTTSTSGEAQINDLVAPGTKNSFDLTSMIDGQPEVAVEVAVKATVTLSGWAVEGDAQYCPVVFFVNGKVFGMNGMKYHDGAEVKTVTSEYANVGALAAAIEAEIEGLDGTDGEAGTKYAPNAQDFGELVENFNLGWEWAFEGVSDDKDSKLGSLSTAPSILITIAPSITQID